jgi:UDP-N-acetylmuramoylalanine--D-glutamate ligase
MNHPLHLVAGLGKTGLSIARYLHRNNTSFIVFDTRKTVPGLAEFSAEFPNVPIYLEQIPQEVLSTLTDIITSPGIPLDTPLLKQALQAGVAVYGDIECLARASDAPMVAITGTNGKSTVTTLVGEMAKAAGFRVAVAGNIGTPVLDLLDDEHQYDLWVLELSSFQLDLTYSLSPVVATILNVSPDHLDRHHTLDAYVQAKQRIYQQTKVALFNRDDASTIPTEEYHSHLPTISFGNGSPGPGNWGLIKQDNKIYLAKGTNAFLPVDSLLIKGVHNWHNALAACALAEEAGIPFHHIVEVLKTFGGLPHRCQWIRTLDDVEWINDSKGTNVGATISAINGIGGSMQGKIVLIAGGQGKGADFQELTQPIADVVPIVRASSLDGAVALAKTQAKPGDVVLLSPACASLDMFRDFNHRGEVFASSVIGL